MMRYLIVFFMNCLLLFGFSIEEAYKDSTQSKSYLDKHTKQMSEKSDDYNYVEISSQEELEEYLKENDNNFGVITGKNDKGKVVNFIKVKNVHIKKEKKLYRTKDDDKYKINLGIQDNKKTRSDNKNFVDMKNVTIDESTNVGIIIKKNNNINDKNINNVKIERSRIGEDKDADRSGIDVDWDMEQ